VTCLPLANVQQDDTSNDQRNDQRRRKEQGEAANDGQDKRQ
jgi:hypothetical protein